MDGCFKNPFSAVLLHGLWLKENNMSGAEESPNAMETDDESHSGNKSPVIQLSTTAQKRRTSRQKKHTNFGQQHAAMRKARATHHERVASRARSRSGSESSSPVCAAKK